VTRQIIQYILPVLAASIILSENITAQQNIPVFGKQNLIGGYEKTIEGEVIQYYSSSPFFAKDALLTRCTDGMKTIRWETANSPEKLNDDYYYFYCLAGHSSGTSGADRKFTLKINDNDYLTFTTPAKKSPPFVWNFVGKDSVAMVFSATNTDIHKDLFGELYLKIPAKLLSPGKPLTISITGNAENSNDWFMLFRYPYKEKIIITPTPFLVYSDNGIRQILQIYLDHIYPEEKSVSIKINNQTTNAALVAGFNKIEIPIDTVIKKTDLKVGITIGKVFEKEFQLIQNPVNRREVDIIHHSHNDIGYSHLQQEVINIQYKNIIDALDMIDKTSGYPEGSKFIWNAETLWPVEHFLKNANEKDKSRFIEAVKNRSIALSCFYAGVMTGLCSPEELRWINEYAVYLRDKLNIPVNTAMMSDIPGVSWSITDAMISDGFRYFSNGPNYIPSLPDKGDRIGSIYKYM
jgi:hypothetical protein